MTTTALSFDDVRMISSDVWASFLGAADDETGLVAATEPLRTDVEGVRAWVSISGAWEGQVVLEMTAATATQATVAMLGLDTVGPDDVLDAVGELVNMVGGNIKSLMPAPSKLTIPVVVQGRIIRALTPDVVEICRADLSWGGQPLRVSVLEALGSREQEGVTNP